MSPTPASQRHSFAEPTRNFYLGAFLDAYLPEAREFPLRATSYTNGGWTVPFPKLYGSSPIILVVWLAMEGQASRRQSDREEG